MLHHIAWSRCARLPVNVADASFRQSHTKNRKCLKKRNFVAIWNG